MTEPTTEELAADRNRWQVHSIELQRQRDEAVSLLREGRCPRCGEWFRDAPVARAFLSRLDEATA